MFKYIKNNIWQLLFCLILGLVISFFIGRSEVKPSVKVVYKHGKTVRDTIYSEKLVPYKVEVPANPILPLTPDTVKLPGGVEYITLKVDTAKIIANYIKENKYKSLMFDNKNGRLVVDAKVQYNELKGMSYEFTPIEKETTITKVPAFIPFISAGYNTLNYANIGCGIFYHNLGLEYNYNIDLHASSYHQFGLKYKF